MAASGGFRAVVAGAVWSLVLISGAFAQARPMEIPAGDLKSALDIYIRQAGVQLIYKLEDVRGLQTHGAHGTLSPEQALNQLLDGTGLIVQRDSSGAMLVRQKNAQAASSGEAAAERSAVETIVVTGTNI